MCGVQKIAGLAVGEVGVSPATGCGVLAAQANDPEAKQEFRELARVCEEVANDMDDRRVSG